MTTETRAAFARRLEMNKSTITRLAQAGRIVLTTSGLVDVERSLALIQDTRGGRDDVAARHAAQRSAPKEAERPAATDVAGATPEQPQPSALNEAARAKAMAESRRVIAQADKEEMERDRLAGDLIDREDVDAAMKFIGAAVRGLLDIFPDQVAPLVTPVSDLAEVQAILTEACRNVLEDFGAAVKRQQEAIAREGEA